MTYGCKTTFNGVLIDREFRNEVLDMDQSKGDTPSDVINCYRFIRLCGLLFEQVSCDTLTGDAVFHPVAY
jgi:hypothetical protein